MRNEMRRPCTLWGKTFDACDVKAVNDYLTFEEESASPSMGYSCGVLIRDPFKGDIASPVYKNKIESYKAIMEAITTIANALNAPVLATEEVLAGLPKDAEALVFTGTYTSIPYNLYWGRHRYSFGKDEVWFFDGFNTNFKNCRIQAKNDPKTAEYLRQFTLNGVRIKEGG